MKNSALIVALFATGIMISFNNVQAQKGLQKGVEASPQFSYLVNQADIDSDRYRTKHAFNGGFGISTQVGFTENLGIGLNVLYSWQGDKYEWRGIERYKMVEYVKIPLMFTVSVPLGMDMLFLGKIGPQIGILTDAKLLNANGTEIISDYSDAFKSADVSGMISFGLGYQISDKLIFDWSLRYDVGLTNAEDDTYPHNIHNPFDVAVPAPSSSPRSNTSNMTLGFSLGLRYNLM